MARRRVTYHSRLPEIADRVEAEIPEVVQRVAQKVEAEAHTRVPRDSERLDQSLRVVQVGKHKAEVRAGGKRNAFYGWMREFGTRNLPAQPFMVPAAESQRDELTGEIRDTFR